MQNFVVVMCCCGTRALAIQASLPFLKLATKVMVPFSMAIKEKKCPFTIYVLISCATFLRSVDVFRKKYRKKLLTESLPGIEPQHPQGFLSDKKGKKRNQKLATFRRLFRESLIVGSITSLVASTPPETHRSHNRGAWSPTIKPRSTSRHVPNHRR